MVTHMPQALVEDAPAPAAPTTSTPVGTGPDAAKKGGAAAESPAAPPPPASKPVAPDKYDLKLPADSFMDEAVVGRTAETAKALGLSNEAAQKVLETQNDAVVDYHRKVMSGHEQQAGEWLAAVEKDPALGGQNMDRTKANIQRALSEHADLRALLVESKFINHPKVVAFLNSIGESRREEPLVTSQHTGQAQRNPADVLYGTQGKKT